MTEEEIQVLQDSLTEAHKKLEEIEIEKESLKKENDEFRSQLQSSTEELKKTKELNYTLARSLDVSKKKKVNSEQLISSMFK